MDVGKPSSKAYEHGKRNHIPRLKPKACQHMVLLIQSCAICFLSHELFLEALSTLQQWTSEDSFSLFDRLPKCSIHMDFNVSTSLKVIWNNVNIQPYIWTQLLFIEPIFLHGVI